MHEEFDGLAALEAIGGANDDESIRLAEHCADCTPCRDALGDYRDAAAGFAIALSPIEPRRDARDTLLLQIEAEALADSRIAEVTEDAAAKARWAVPVGWFATAAVFFLALFGWSELRLRALHEELKVLETEKVAISSENMRLANEAQIAHERLDTMRSASQLFPLAAAENTTRAHANAFIDRTRHRAVVVFENLDPNDSSHSYQLWIIRGDLKPPMSAAVFDADADGRAEIEVSDMPPELSVAGLAVTLEPRGGLATPSGKVLLHGKA